MVEGLLANLAIGFSAAASPQNLLYCFGGVFLGTLIGVLPGIGSLAAVSMLLPLSFYLEPLTAIVMLAGVYYGAEYGGSTASILLNLPGTPSSAVTCLDGYPMARQGRAGVALFMTTIASFFGGTVGILMLMLLAPVLAGVASTFQSPDYFALMVFGLIAAVVVTRGSRLKGLAMVVLGLLLGSVGIDTNSGVARFTLGFTGLYDGISLVALAMGLFGVAEIIASIRQSADRHFSGRVTLRALLPTGGDLRQSGLPMLRGSLIGTFFGALPGAGQSIASFVSYAAEKQLSRHPQRFGAGAIEGITAPESSNNAAVQAAFIPTLTLGIPGSATMALMLGALMIHGVAPGPALINGNPQVFWGLIASFWIGNLMLLVLNIPMIGLWVRLLQIPYRLLYPAVLCLICVGVYSISNNPLDIGAVLALGALGYFMRIHGFEPAPLLLGFVLGPLLEENFRRAMLLARGDYLALFQRPLTGAILALAGMLLLWVIVDVVRGAARTPPPARR